MTIFWPVFIWFKLYPHLNEAKTKGPSISKARHSVDYCPLATRKDTTHIQNIGVMREKSSKRQKKNRFFGSSKNEQKKSKIAASLCPPLWQLGVLWTFRSDWHITWTNTTHKCKELNCFNIWNISFCETNALTFVSTCLDLIYGIGWRFSLHFCPTWYTSMSLFADGSQIQMVRN